MTVLKWLMSTGVCTTAELIAFKKADVDGSDYRTLSAWAAEEMRNKGIEVEVADAKH